MSLGVVRVLPELKYKMKKKNECLWNIKSWAKIKTKELVACSPLLLLTAGAVACGQVQRAFGSKLERGYRLMP